MVEFFFCFLHSGEPLESLESPKWIGSHLRTLALKTENFSKKIGRFSKTRKWIY